jgi:hypothetical protein
MKARRASRIIALPLLGGQRQAPAALRPVKIRYPLYRSLGGPRSRSGLVRKISPLPGFDSRTVQPVASRYTDWASPAHIVPGTWRKSPYGHGTWKFNDTNDSSTYVRVRVCVCVRGRSASRVYIDCNRNVTDVSLNNSRHISMKHYNWYNQCATWDTLY